MTDLSEQQSTISSPPVVNNEKELIQKGVEAWNKFIDKTKDTQSFSDFDKHEQDFRIEINHLIMEARAKFCKRELVFSMPKITQDFSL